MPQGSHAEPKCHPCNGHCYQGRRCPDRAAAKLDLRDVVVRVAHMLKRAQSTGGGRPSAG